VDLHGQQVSLPRLRVLHDPETDVLVTERLVLPPRLLELARLGVVRVLAERLSTLVELGRVALARILGHGDICPVAVVAAIRAAVPVHVFVGGAVVARIVLRVEEDIVVRSRVIASVAVVIALGLVVGVGVAIIVVFTMRRLPRVCLLAGLFSLAERVFTGFALR
jgi:hypothetical protein